MIWNKIIQYKDNYLLFTIPNNKKKYRVDIFDDKLQKIKTVYFGAKNYEQYFDKIGYYTDLNHGDNKRRLNYRRRHGKILNKDGKPSYTIQFTPAWFSWNILW